MKWEGANKFKVFAWNSRSFVGPHTLETEIVFNIPPHHLRTHLYTHIQTHYHMFHARALRHILHLHSLAPSQRKWEFWLACGSMKSWSESITLYVYLSQTGPPSSDTPASPESQAQETVEAPTSSTATATSTQYTDDIANGYRWVPGAGLMTAHSFLCIVRFLHSSSSASPVTVSF